MRDREDDPVTAGVMVYVAFTLWVLAFAVGCQVPEVPILGIELDSDCPAVADCMLEHCRPFQFSSEERQSVHAAGCAEVCVGLAGRPDDHREWFMDLWFCETGHEPGHSLCDDLIEECRE